MLGMVQMVTEVLDSDPVSLLEVSRGGWLEPGMTASGPRHLSMYPRCLNKCCHFLSVLSCEEYQDRLAKPLLDIWNLV